MIPSIILNGVRSCCYITFIHLLPSEQKGKRGSKIQLKLAVLCEKGAISVNFLAIKLPITTDTLKFVLSLYLRECKTRARRGQRGLIEKPLMILPHFSHPFAFIVFLILLVIGVITLSLQILPYAPYSTLLCSSCQSYSIIICRSLSPSEEFHTRTNFITKGNYD